MMNDCCNGCACRKWIEEMGYDPDDSYPEEVCSRCGFEGPFYCFNEAQKYGWGGSPSMREKLAVLRSEKEPEIERLFQYVVRSLKAKVNFKGIVEEFEKKLGSHDKAVEVADSMLTLAASAIEATEDDEQARAFYEEQTEGRLPIEPAAFPEFRKLLEDEMAVWFRARGLLLIGEPVEAVESLFNEDDGDGGEL